MRSRSVSFVPAPDPSTLPQPTLHQSLLTVPSSDSEPSVLSSALHESLADCYDSMDNAGRQNLLFSAMAFKDYTLLQSLLQLQKVKGTFTLPKKKFIDKNGTINLFDENNSTVANGAVFILFQSHVDKYYANQMHSNYNGKGDQALLYLQRSCA